MTSYQTHDPAEPGMSDSFGKLARLGLSQDLTGRRVLDIGCNEGFFCNVAAQRGAAEVVGLDFVAEFLDPGRARYPDPAITWLHQNWNSLPGGAFDLVLWCSGMHYEDDSAAMLQRIADLLTPDGLLVLECGVADMGGREMMEIQRPSDSRWFPTREFLRDGLLRPFCVRQVAKPEMIMGDPIPRGVYHCRQRQPMVLLVRGEHDEADSTLLRGLVRTAAKTVRLRPFVDRLRQSQYGHSALQRHLQSLAHVHDLAAVFAGLDAAGLTQDCADVLAQAVAASDEVVVFDGPLSEAPMGALAARLAGRTIVWHGTRRLGR